jgi:lipoprotein-anchoring transpeptidase ErfK/SrfK
VVAAAAAAAVVVVAGGGAVFALSGSSGKASPAAVVKQAAAVEAGGGKKGTPPSPLVVTPASGATGVPLDTVVQVSVATGRLNQVAVTTPSGAALAGALSPDGKAWTATARLAAATTYKVVASEVHGAVQGAPTTSTFTTLTPAKKVKAGIAPLDGMTVGVGQPVAVYLSAPVKDHTKVLPHLTVTTDPQVQGAWHWVSDSELHWRPQAYWATGTKVTVATDLSGVDLGGGAWGVESRTIHFTIGDAHVSTVDATTHLMTVTSNGQVVKTIKVSTGRDKYPTKSGVHVVLDKAQKTVMDSSTVGIPVNSPDGYKETVLWNVRISNSGEFVHAAPWSVGSQGRANVSHGCVNVSTADATWFFGFSQLGDVVDVHGTPQNLEPTNGFGDWNVPWEQWAN